MTHFFNRSTFSFFLSCNSSRSRFICSCFSFVIGKRLIDKIPTNKATDGKKNIRILNPKIVSSVVPRGLKTVHPTLLKTKLIVKKIKIVENLVIKACIPK